MSWRLPLVLLLWVLILGGLQLFLRQPPLDAAGELAVSAPAPGDYSLELTATFSPAPDPFAFTATGERSAPLVIRLLGQEIFSAAELQPQVPVRIAPVPGLVLGVNEFTLGAAPPAGDFDASHAVRLRLLLGELPVADATFWAEPGTALQGVLRVELGAGGEDDHAHR